MNQEEIKKYKQAGKIAKQVVEYSKKFIKKEMLLLEIAEKIEDKIIELGGEIAFPTNLSINDIAAHYTPEHNDESEAGGLLKVDLGVHVDGYIADTAFSLDLENNPENKELIKSAEKGLDTAIKTIKENIEIKKIGQAVQETITKLDFSPVRNLSGHRLEKFKLHTGITIPSYDNNNTNKINQGAYAVEPFTTTGIGVVYEGKPSGIYKLVSKKAIRDNQAREILKYIEENYSTLPFCSRWIIKKFGTRALISLNLLEKAEIISQYPQLIEKSHKKVAQAEHTILVSSKIEITTI